MIFLHFDRILFQALVAFRYPVTFRDGPCAVRTSVHTGDTRMDEKNENIRQIRALARRKRRKEQRQNNEIRLLGPDSFRYDTASGNGRVDGVACCGAASHAVLARDVICDSKCSGNPLSVPSPLTFGMIGLACGLLLRLRRRNTKRF